MNANQTKIYNDFFSGSAMSLPPDIVALLPDAELLKYAKLLREKREQHAAAALAEKRKRDKAFREKYPLVAVRVKGDVAPASGNSDRKRIAYLPADETTRKLAQDLANELLSTKAAVIGLAELVNAVKKWQGGGELLRQMASLTHALAAKSDKRTDTQNSASGANRG